MPSLPRRRPSTLEHAPGVDLQMPPYRSLETISGPSWPPPDFVTPTPTVGPVTNKISQFGTLAERMEHTRRVQGRHAPHVSALVDEDWLPGLLVTWERRDNAWWARVIVARAGEAEVFDLGARWLRPCECVCDVFVLLGDRPDRTRRLRARPGGIAPPHHRRRPDTLHGDQSDRAATVRARHHPTRRATQTDGSDSTLICTPPGSLSTPTTSRPGRPSPPAGGLGSARTRL